MAQQTKISWADSTINWWSGCTKVSPGCAHCYAETRDKRHMIEARDHWGKGAPRLKHVGAVKQALAMNRRPWICDGCGNAEIHKTPAERFYGCQKCKCLTQHRRRIFSLSLGDIGDTEIPFEWFNEAMVTIDKCDEVIWILCTKRPVEFLERWLKVCEHWGRTDTRLPENIVMLTSVENHVAADLRIPQLLRIPAACHGLSLEPLLGPVDITLSKDSIPPVSVIATGNLQWLIIGGESGPAARPCNVDWIRSLVRQGHAAGVATFVKQLGSSPFVTTYSGNMSIAPEYKRPFINGLYLSDKKGGDISEWPSDLRVQQWPAGF